MPNTRLIAVITALLLLGSGSGALAAYSLDQLKEIERLVMSRDAAALSDYLKAHPEITQGSDALARELGSFQACANAGGISCFDDATAIQPPKRTSKADITKAPAPPAQPAQPPKPTPTPTGTAIY